MRDGDKRITRTCWLLVQLQAVEVIYRYFPVETFNSWSWTVFLASTGSAISEQSVQKWQPIVNITFPEREGQTWWKGGKSKMYLMRLSTNTRASPTLTVLRTLAWAYTGANSSTSVPILWHSAEYRDLSNTCTSAVNRVHCRASIVCPSDRMADGSLTSLHWHHCRKVHISYHLPQRGRPAAPGS